METCYLLFGSNMGNKISVFDQACHLINRNCGRITAMSSAYESEPWGFEADEWFLNRLLVLETALEPALLMSRLLEIEAELGRVRFPSSQGYVSRTIDLDIIYYGNRVMHEGEVVVPHPRLHLRRFVLVPLCEVCPDLVHPVFHRTNSELLAQCDDRLEVLKMMPPI